MCLQFTFLLLGPPFQGYETPRKKKLPIKQVAGTVDKALKKGGDLGAEKGV